MSSFLRETMNPQKKERRSFQIKSRLMMFCVVFSRKNSFPPSFRNRDRQEQGRLYSRADFLHQSQNCPKPAPEPYARQQVGPASSQVLDSSEIVPPRHQRACNPPAPWENAPEADRHPTLWLRCESWHADSPCYAGRQP